MKLRPLLFILAACIAGSARRESFNWRFPAVAVDALRQAGAEVTLLDLRDFALPLKASG